MFTAEKLRIVFVGFRDFGSIITNKQTSTLRNKENGTFMNTIITQELWMQYM